MSHLLQKILAEKGYNALPAPAPRARASPIQTSQQLIQRALKEMPKGRVALAPSDQAYGSWWSHDHYEGRDRCDVIELCRRACVEDTDAGGALADLIALALPPLADGTPGVWMEFEGGTRAVQQAEREIAVLLDRLHLPLHELCANGMREVYQAGACAQEWYPNRSRTGIQGVEIIPAEELYPQRQNNQRLWRQANNDQPLNANTFVYSPYGTRGREEYGTPAMISALRELERKANIVLGVDKVIRLLSQGIFLKIGVPEQTPEDLGFDDQNDPEFIAARAGAYQAYVEVAAAARDLGIAAFEDETQMDAIPLTGNVRGLSELEQMNALKVWSGLMTLPFMRGRMDSTTQALAQVVYPIVLTHGLAVRQAQTRSVEFGLNLHLRLAGVAATARLSYQEPLNPFRLEFAQADNAQADTDAKYADLYGEQYVRWAAQRDGFDPDQAVSHWVARPNIHATPHPGGDPSAPEPQNQKP